MKTKKKLRPIKNSIEGIKLWLDNDYYMDLLAKIHRVLGYDYIMTSKEIETAYNDLIIDCGIDESDCQKDFKLEGGEIHTQSHYCEVDWQHNSDKWDVQEGRFKTITTYHMKQGKGMQKQLDRAIMNKAYPELAKYGYVLYSATFGSINDIYVQADRSMKLPSLYVPYEAFLTKDKTKVKDSIIEGIKNQHDCMKKKFQLAATTRKVEKSEGYKLVMKLMKPSPKFEEL